MTDGQLSLVEIPPAAPKLTERQQAVLDAVTHAGADGLHADEAGAMLCERNRRHSADERCEWCSSNGLGVLRRLRELDLVRYRSKLKAWTATDAPNKPDELPPGMTDEIPF